jgi:ABC-2 type transport system permease protein
MIRHILAITAKEFQILLKDKGSLAVLFLLPLLLASIMGGPAALSEGGSEATGEEPVLVLDVRVVNQDTGVYGGEVVKALRGVNVLDVTESDQLAEADQLVADGEIPAAIVIPADFTKQIDAGEPTAVQVVGDPTQEEAAGIVAGIANRAVAELGLVAEIRYGIRAVLDQTGALDGAPEEIRQAAEAQTLGVIWTQVQQVRQDPVIAVRSEDLAGVETRPASGPMDWYITGFTVMFAFFLLPVVGETLLRERQDGTFRRLLAAPLRHSSVIAGLMLAYALIVVLQVLFMFGVGRVVFNINLGDSPWGLVLITIVIALASASLGLLVGAVSRSSEQANTLGLMLGFILSVVGGFPLPWFRLGGVAGQISLISPHSHAIIAYSGLMVDGLTLGDVSIHILALLGFAVVFFAAAVWRFRFE